MSTYICRGYRRKVTPQHKYSTTLLTLEALKNLEDIFGQKVQEDFISIFHTKFQQVIYPYSLSYLPSSSRSHSDQILQLKFIKDNLFTLYRYMLQNTRCSDFVRVINDSENYNYREEFWYLCHDENWIEEAEKFVLSEFERLTDSEERYTPETFKLALMCKYLTNEREVLTKYVKSALNTEKYGSHKKRTKNDGERASSLEKTHSEEQRRLREKLQKLKEVPLRRVQLIFEHRDQIKDLEERIKQEEKSIERLIETISVNKRSFKGVYDEEAYNYLRDWVKEQKQ